MVSFPNYSVTYLLHLLLGTIVFFSFLKLRKSYQDTDLNTLKHFYKFFASFSLFLLIMGLPALIPVSLTPVKLGAFYIFGHIFLYASIAYYILVPFELSFPSYKKYAFGLDIIFGAIITFVNLIFWTEPQIVGNITVFNVSPPVGPLIGIFAGISWIIFGTIYFAVKGYKASGITRKKFLIFSLALLVMTIGGPLHDNATSLFLYYVADVLTLGGILLLMVGIYAKDWFGDNEVS